MLEQLAEFLKLLTRDLTLDDLRKVQALTAKLNDWLRSALPQGPEVLSILTYDEAMGYFVDRQPETPKNVRGALLRQAHPQGFLVTQVFLKEGNRIVSGAGGQMLGRRIVAKSFDAELNRAFGDTDLIIAE